ncbi:unnamed protein product [Prorocentrum cordatum]|uniref:Uncharacterized protein n=1 Tax=Prorocentrum cordatum TaxID=2364126 RepID=A0ABN9T4A7_9DINO|nr:unnamed protein product [Polarella glacialis]
MARPAPLPRLALALGVASASAALDEGPPARRLRGGAAANCSGAARGQAACEEDDGVSGRCLASGLPCGYNGNPWCAADALDKCCCDYGHCAPQLGNAAGIIQMQCYPAGKCISPAEDPSQALCGAGGQQQIPCCGDAVCRPIAGGEGHRRGRPAAHLARRGWAEPGPEVRARASLARPGGCATRPSWARVESRLGSARWIGGVPHRTSGGVPLMACARPPSTSKGPGTSSGTPSTSRSTCVDWNMPCDYYSQCCDGYQCTWANTDPKPSTICLSPGGDQHGPEGSCAAWNEPCDYYNECCSTYTCTWANTEPEPSTICL